MATRKANPRTSRVRGVNALKGRRTYCRAASRARLNGVVNRGRRAICLMRSANCGRDQDQSLYSNQDPAKAFVRCFPVVAARSGDQLQKRRQLRARHLVLVVSKSPAGSRRQRGPLCSGPALKESERYEVLQGFVRPIEFVAANADLKYPRDG